MIKYICLFILVATLSRSATFSQELRGKLIPPPTDCEAGYEKGVSSQYHFFDTYRMIVAGGANFPNTPAADDGQKVFYKGIYALENDKWQKIGDLIEPVAYEAFFSVVNSKVLITNALRKSPVVYKPILDTIEINSENDLPEKIIQPVIMSDSAYLYIWGGFSVVPAVSISVSQGYRSELPSVPVGGWKVNKLTGEVRKIAAPPTENLTGATAVAYKDGFLIVGGVNRAIFESALLRRERMKTAQGANYDRLKFEDGKYMRMADAQYKFNDKLLFYNPKSDKWQTLGHSEHLARAGAAAVIDNHQRLIVTGGEKKPGIRNPITWVFDLATLP